MGTGGGGGGGGGVRWLAQKKCPETRGKGCDMCQ